MIKNKILIKYKKYFQIIFKNINNRLKIFYDCK